MILRVALLLALTLALDWMPDMPPVPLLAHAQKVSAQAPYPPNAWHPYRGGTNCVQVSDSNGNFNCSPLVTINPTTGLLSISGSQGNIFSSGIVIAPLGTSAQVLGSGDLVISTSPVTIASSGPLIQGAVLRIRSRAGQCQLVVSGGNGFQEFIIPVLPASGGLIASGSAGFTSGPQPFPGNALLQTTFAGGPNGC